MMYEISANPRTHWNNTSILNVWIVTDFSVWCYTSQLKCSIAEKFSCQQFYSAFRLFSCSKLASAAAALERHGDGAVRRGGGRGHRQVPGAHQEGDQGDNRPGEGST